MNLQRHNLLGLVLGVYAVPFRTVRGLAIMLVLHTARYKILVTSRKSWFEGWEMRLLPAGRSN
jgi:hypothetical protein